ncbi:MAG TPA: hotdog fold thioesterase [Candidatus Kapabacteria bacterium]|nr:hotdog fold thioesterase [Candidatus Kapabacteria bacterium]
MIWRTPINLDEMNSAPEYIGTFLGIKFTEWTDDSLTATMPYSNKTRQPWSIMHGGASVVLAETVGSYASSLIIDPDKYLAVGLEVNANHIRPVTSGLVKAVGIPIHLGKKTHIWDIKLYNEAGKITCISRLTVAIVDK